MTNPGDVWVSTFTNGGDGLYWVATRKGLTKNLTPAEVIRVVQESLGGEAIAMSRPCS